MSILLLNSNALNMPLADQSVNCVVTSPPYYGLRDYGVAGQLGKEPTPEAYTWQVVNVFREVWRVLRDDGTVWLNLGDSYAGSGGAGGDYNEGGLKEGQPRYKSGMKINRAKDRKTDIWGGGHVPATGVLKPKDMIGIPWRVAFALQADGWYLRSDIIWHKPNPMPESVRDRPTKAHEYIFLLTKSARYYYDQEAIREPIKNSSVARLSQDVDKQEGSVRTNGGRKTNRKMKAVRFGGTKAEGYGNPTYSGKEWKPKNLQDESRKPRSMHVARANGEGEVVAEFGANKKSVWTVPTQPYTGAHFAAYPPDLIEPCIMAGCPKDGIVLDPFCGSGVTAMVARKLGRHAVGLDINLTYILECARTRLSLDALDQWENGIKARGEHTDLPLFMYQDKESA